MAEEVYWITLGQHSDGSTSYAQGIIHLPYWKESAMRNKMVVTVIEVKVDLEKGKVSTELIKKPKEIK